MKVSNPVVINALLAKNAEVEGAVSNAFDELTIKKDGRYWRIYQGSNDAGMRVFDNPESAKKFIKEKWGDGWKIRVKNADVEGAVAENAAFKVGDKVVMRDGRKGEVVSSAPGPMGGEMYHIRLEDGRLTDSAERNLTAVNASRAVARNASTSADQLHTLASQALIAAKKAREYADECIRNLDSLDGEEYKTKKQEYARAFKPLLELSKINFGKVSVM